MLRREGSREPIRARTVSTGKVPLRRRSQKTRPTFALRPRMGNPDRRPRWWPDGTCGQAAPRRQAAPPGKVCSASEAGFRAAL